MKYKILITGWDKVAVDDFFQHLEEDFEVQTTSIRSNDFMSHLRYFAPHAFVVCLRNEDEESISTILSYRRALEDRNIPIIIIGSRDECDRIKRTAGGMSGLILSKPISVYSIREQTLLFLEKWYESEKQKEAAKEEAEKQKETEISPAKKHVLVVDDDPMMLKLIKEHLKDLYMVGTAINGSVALKFLENKKTDLIILDYEMPGENGAQVLEKIRKNEETAQLPVIFLTGMNDKSKIKKVLELKPQGYLLKPIEKEMLLKAVKGIIG